MSMSLIAILLSLAMMLTGAGGEGMPAQSARTLTLRNVVVTLNGETQRLTPEAHIGVMSDGENAVFDFGVDVDGQALMPIQIGVGERGLTALFEESGVALNVTKEALDNAVAMAGETMGAMTADVENPEVLAFLTEEYLPAYTGLLTAMSDKTSQAAIQKKAEALVDDMIDRGEGTPDQVVIDDVTYDVLSYHYTIDGAQMGALADALFAAAPELTAYADATFRLYSMLPEESGLNDVQSYSDMMTKFGIDMTMEMDEQHSEDGLVQVADAVLTMDMSGLSAMMVEQQAAEVPLPEEDAVVEPEPTPEPIVLEPLVMNIHSLAVGDASGSTVDFDYAIGDTAMAFEANAAQDSTTVSMEMTGTVSVDGEKTGKMSLSCAQAANEDGGNSYGFSASIVSKDALQLDASVYGDASADGTAYNSVSVDGRTPDTSFGLSFDVEISADAIEDKVSAAEPAVVIDDLSEEAMEALGEDQNLLGAMMKVGGSLTMDASKLTQDQSIRNLVALLSGERLPITVEDEPETDYDYTYEIDGDDFVIEGLDDVEGDYEMAEDDGELGFEVPELTWLPEGWTVAVVERDTAYDWAGVSVTDENGDEVMYATFFQDMDGETTNYTVNDNGAVQQGRAMSVSDYGEGGMAVTLRENGLYGNLSFASGAIDVDTLGRIVAGVRY